MKPYNRKKIRPQLIIDPIVYLQSRFLVEECNKELAWHGYIEKIDEEIYYLYQIQVYPQYTTGATVDPDEDEYYTWLTKQMEREDFTNMRLHCHSHVAMGVTPSAIDNAYRQDMLANLKENDYYIFMILNKKGAYDIELYSTTDAMLYEKSDIEIYIGTPQTLLETLTDTQETIKENIKERKCIPCSTIRNQQNFLTQETKSKTKKSKSLGVEQWDQQWQSYYAGSEYYS